MTKQSLKNCVISYEIIQDLARPYGPYTNQIRPYKTLAQPYKTKENTTVIQQYNHLNYTVWYCT